MKAIAVLLLAACGPAVDWPSRSFSAHTSADAVRADIAAINEAVGCAWLSYGGATLVMFDQPRAELAQLGDSCETIGFYDITRDRVLVAAGLDADRQAWVLLHELGHAVGLSHSHLTVMNATYPAMSRAAQLASFADLVTAAGLVDCR